jgi:inorganic pyrophosphatase
MSPNQVFIGFLKDCKVLGAFALIEQGKLEWKIVSVAASYAD